MAPVTAVAPTDSMAGPTDLAPAVAAHGLATRHRFPDAPLDDHTFRRLLATGEQHRLIGLLGAAVAAGALPATALVDWETGLVTPYPKPITLDLEARGLVPGVDWDHDVLPPPVEREQWHLEPARVGPGRVGTTCPPGWIVLPGYEPGSATALEPLTGAEALVELAKNVFGFSGRARRSLDTLARITRDVPCYRLRRGELTDAVALLRDLTGTGVDSQPGPAA